ncbi:MAG: phosphoribosylformylglycinamidine synthase subunit PurS [Candidatus Aenigmarchaeota archaeon]|nr:phosphoribosylformylglycinamidine synthase subunit PurS [Candidatus Aenigmarchaeota archaeon]
MWVVGVGYKDGQKDPLGKNVSSDIAELGFSNVTDVKTLQTYVFESEISKEGVENAAKELFTDNVIQYFNFSKFDENGAHVNNLVKEKNVWVVEVFFKQGVMDPAGLSVQNALDILGHKDMKVKTGTFYVISGNVSEDELKDICSRYLTNEMIHTYRYHRL